MEQRYPSGRVVKNVLDTSGDLSMVQSARCMNAAAGTAQAGRLKPGLKTGIPHSEIRFRVAPSLTVGLLTRWAPETGGWKILLPFRERVGGHPNPGFHPGL
ncbi:MAG: hypothetical protein IPM21_05970 [Acidobacteria bacterium]|nr:hypothetical protein [Acidobacteriota bacterium]